MIICLSGFVIPGASPGVAAHRTDLATAGARYSLPHHVALQRAAQRSSSSSAESVSSASPPPAPPLYSRVRTLYACLGEGEGELSFEPNQVITRVAPSGEPGWLRGELDGRAGLVPENYVEPLP